MSARFRPLTERQAAFAACYAGDGVRACRQAGYGGSASSLAEMASRLLKDPRIEAIIVERRAASAPPAPARPAPAPRPRPAPDATPGATAEGPGAPPPDSDAPPSATDGDAPIEVLRALAHDETVHPSARVAAAKAVARLERDAAADRGDQMTRLRTAMRDALRAKHERETRKADR